MATEIEKQQSWWTFGELQLLSWGAKRMKPNLRSKMEYMLKELRVMKKQIKILKKGDNPWNKDEIWNNADKDNSDHGHASSPVDYPLKATEEDALDIDVALEENICHIDAEDTPDFGNELVEVSDIVTNGDSGESLFIEDDSEKIFNEKVRTEYTGKYQRKSCRVRRPGPHLVTPFRVGVPNKKRRIQTYNPLKPLPKKSRDELKELIEKWNATPCLKICVEGNIVEPQFILDIIKVGAWLSFSHIDVGLTLLRKRRVDHPAVFGTNWTTTDYSFSAFLIVDYEKTKNLADMSNWCPDTRLDKYMRGTRPSFSTSWDEVDLIYMPIIVSTNHWLLVVANLADCYMTVYDPRVNLHTWDELMIELKPLAVMFPHLLNKFGISRSITNFNGSLSPWPISLTKNVPQQTTDDCGVYTIKFVDCLTASFDLGNWSKYDIQSIRLRLAIELISGSAYLW
ncbi:uncharacterized protein LOC126800657 [Argentina anserina]|uniref:uncharacterized protein LOC126800657 n=1 Tax=Argentina anserina TaxID=57926 RepID=UPI0021764352|nr:uncharacterized protein LOC126800657 [Potentilla anserina]